MLVCPFAFSKCHYDITIILICINWTRKSSLWFWILEEFIKIWCHFIFKCQANQPIVGDGWARDLWTPWEQSNAWPRNMKCQKPTIQTSWSLAQWHINRCPALLTTAWIALECFTYCVLKIVLRPCTFRLVACFSPFYCV